MVTLAGMGRTCTDTDPILMRWGIKVFGWGLLERFIVSKRLVVAEIALIEDDAVERVALVTGVRILLVPNDQAISCCEMPLEIG